MNINAIQQSNQSFGAFRLHSDLTTDYPFNTVSKLVKLQHNKKISKTAKHGDVYFRKTKDGLKVRVRAEGQVATCLIKDPIKASIQTIANTIVSTIKLAESKKK